LQIIFSDAGVVAAGAAGWAAGVCGSSANAIVAVEMKRPVANVIVKARIGSSPV
jgi:hypothetical protein